MDPYFSILARTQYQERLEHAAQSHRQPAEAGSNRISIFQALLALLTPKGNTASQNHKAKHAA